jgi:hypothetical protein
MAGAKTGSSGALSMRHIDKGTHPVRSDGQPVVFEKYQDAAPHLFERIGRYCSYCERNIPVSLAVEHKLPKLHHAQHEKTWTNFLLSCANCNSTKGTTDTANMALAWPDIDDTFSQVEYSRSGAVVPSKAQSLETQTKVQGLLDLVGLSRPPNRLGRTDHRFFDRLEVWSKAEASREDLLAQDTPNMRRAILRTAVLAGGYSIWMEVFASDQDMRQALCDAFPGTVVKKTEASF